MSHELPLVTIITPVYNRASFLDETILSVLNQDYENLEYIVLDDGSTDNSLEIIKKYERVTWSSHKNMGETRTVNRGFERASGEIIGVVNSDDPLLPGAIRSITERFFENPDLVVIYPDWIMIDKYGSAIEEMTTFNYSYRDMIRWHHCIPGPGTFFRRKILTELKGRDTQFRFVGDFDFWMRAGLCGKFERMPKKLAAFRVHPDSASVKNTGTEMAREHLILTKKYFSMPDLPPEIMKVKNEAISSTYYVASVVCCKDYLSSIAYFALALWYSPLKYLGEYRYRVKNSFSYAAGLTFGFVKSKIRGERLS